MGREEDDIVILLGLGIVGAMDYVTWWKDKPIEEIIADVDTKLKSFLDDIASKLPALPPIPTPQFPPLPPASGSLVPPAPPATPDKETPPPPANSTTPSTNTADTSEDNEPKINDPPVKPEGSGQVPNNPPVPPPPAGSGGAIIAFAGDWDSNNKSVATTAAIEKQGCQLIVGVGDYSYTDQSATDWFAKNVGAKWSGKMKGCIGNHDVHDKAGFLRLFQQTAWNSAAKVAPNLTVVFIDTESGIDEATLTSLTKAAKAQSKHVAYVFHKPYITSANGHHGPGENKWRTIIDNAAKANQVKLVIAGHNHLYEHFTCNGIHYVTTGAAGRKFYGGNCQGSCGPVKCVENTNGFLKVSVGASLRCQFISNSGQELDTFDIA